MVERLSSVEIEDVLSSIRRLVTEDLRPRTTLRDGKLMLTPALRVVPDIADEEPHGGQAEGSVPVAEDAEGPAAVAAMVFNLNASLAKALDDAGPADKMPETDIWASEETSKGPMFLHRANRVAATTPPIVPPAQASADLPVSDLPVSDLPVSDLPVEDALQSGETAARDHAELVASIGSAIPADGYELENGDVMSVPEWPESSWMAPEVIDQVEDAEVIIPPFDATEDTSLDAGTGYDDSDWAIEPEAALYDTTGPVLPDPEIEATAEVDANEAAALAAMAAGDAGQIDALTELDEDMLREIVRQIIREELQGSLGERITRNVRKLVRAEINRAILGQDLE